MLVRMMTLMPMLTTDGADYDAYDDYGVYSGDDYVALRSNDTSRLYDDVHFFYKNNKRTSLKIGQK